MLNLNKRFNTNGVLILSLWIFSFITILFFYQNTQKQIGNSILNLVGKLTFESSKNVDIDIENKFNILDTVAYNISKEDLSNPQKLAESFSELVKKNKLRKMAIVTPDGTAYYDNGDISNVSDRDYFKASMNGDRYVSHVFNSSIDGKRINVFSIPIYIDNDIVGVMFSVILSDEFYEEFNLDNVKEVGDTFIINSDGDVIASDEKSMFNSDNFNMFDKLKSEGIRIEEKDLKYNSKGYLEVSFSNKNNYILYYSKLSYSNWLVITLIDNNTIKTYYNNIIENTTFVIILSVLLISLGFMIVFNKDKRNFKLLKDMVYRDIITDGNNDKYIKDNIFNIINTKDRFAFISLEILNIKNIVTISGLNNAKFILNEVYIYLNNILNEDEIVIHSYFGEYKLLIKYSDIRDFTKRLEDIDFSKINENIKFIMGIYLIDDLDVSFEDMCSYASIAKEALNADNQNSKYMIYNKQMHKKEIDKLKLEDDIKSAIENKEFKAWFQPKYGQDGKSIIGAEALVRWYKYESIVLPHVFVPICETNGLIKQIDELVFEDVCKNIREWINNDKIVVPISINLSRSYLDKDSFIYNLERYIYKYKVPKELINFEITESSMVGNEDKLKEIVSLLHKKGFRVLLDDFGVGYSSIKAISYVNFDVLKIDKSFIDGIGEEKWESIIRYTIDMANKLGMDVIAEGIENEEQYKFLLECNCEMFQGYYFNKPMNSNYFSKLI